MFRIRRIYDDVLSVNQEALRQVKEMLRDHFSAVKEKEVDSLGEKLRNPFKHRFRSILLVAEGRRGQVQGFALVMHDPKLRFCFLDYLAAARRLTSRGIGGALYEAVRDEAKALGGLGLFFECLPDDPALCPDESMLRQNRARLRFYERYGARPIVNTDYERPVKPCDTCPPHLVFDGLDRQRPLRRLFARQVVQAILRRKYRRLCSRDYVLGVLASFVDDPVRLREPRQNSRPRPAPAVSRPVREPIALVVNDRHDIHHLRDRGYVQAPVRITRILAELRRSGLFEEREPESFSMQHIISVHDAEYVRYLRRVCANVPAGQSVYPYVFPLRNQARRPRELSVRAGYYCIDTFTPLNPNAYLAARRAVDCALTAARAVLHGRRLAYALVRPPGHHAERRAFGGFCYLNNAAIAAQLLSAQGKVALLDLDYHHGNGQQEIFYERSDVLTLSIHGHPNLAYPYFTGFAEERGRGDGEGYNLNLPQPETLDGTGYRRPLASALRAVRAFGPTFLVLALGLDTARGDPTGSWLLSADDFEANGRAVGELGLPTLVVQEGGYRTRTLGTNARRFFQGLFEATHRR